MLSLCISRGLTSADSAQGEVLLWEVVGEKAVMMDGAEAPCWGAQGPAWECVWVLNQCVQHKGLFLMKHMQTLGRLKRLPLGFSRCFKRRGQSKRCKYLSGAIFTLPIWDSQTVLKNAVQCFILFLDSMSNFYFIVFISFLLLKENASHFLSHYPLQIPYSAWIAYC